MLIDLRNYRSNDVPCVRGNNAFLNNIISSNIKIRQDQETYSFGCRKHKTVVEDDIYSNVLAVVSY